MKHLDDINRPYIPAAKTDIAATLKRLGFEPPSESKWFQEKWATYRNLAARNERKIK